MIKSPVKLLITIVPRGKGADVAKCFKDNGATLQYVLYGHGTAKSDIIDYLGFDEPEKDVLLGFVPSNDASEIQKKLDDLICFSRQGTGISFSVLLSSVSAGFAKRVELNMENAKGVYEPMESNDKFEMIVCALERGLSDVAMTAAKSVGARGGTVIKAREAEPDETKKIFGFTIQPEKEILLLVVNHDIKNEIMKAVCGAVASESEERAIMFSVPVEDVAGIGKNPL